MVLVLLNIGSLAPEDQFLVFILSFAMGFVHPGILCTISALSSQDFLPVVCIYGRHSYKRSSCHSQVIDWSNSSCVASYK